MPIRAAAVCGLAAPVAFVVGVFVGDAVQPDPFDPAHNDIGHLGALTASSPWLYNQLGANLTGLLLVCLALGLRRALGPGWAAFSAIGPGAASRAGSVAWFLWIAFIAVRLWQGTTPGVTRAADTVQA